MNINFDRWRCLCSKNPLKQIVPTCSTTIRRSDDMNRNFPFLANTYTYAYANTYTYTYTYAYTYASLSNLCRNLGISIMCSSTT